MGIDVYAPDSPCTQSRGGNAQDSGAASSIENRSSNFIGGLDEKLRVPRRTEPRQQVAAGSVGIADGRTGLYAMASPGGWTLIGRTPHRLFDAAAAEPFALQPGMRVRFRSIAADGFED